MIYPVPFSKQATIQITTNDRVCGLRFMRYYELRSVVSAIVRH